MYPIIFQIAGQPVYTLSLFSVLAFGVSGFILWRRLLDLGYEEKKVINLILFSTLSAVVFGYVGGRVEGFNGCSFLGLCFGLGLAFFYFIRREKIDFWRLGDELVFALIPLALLLQLGSFFAGLYMGQPTTQPWGYYFPGFSLRRLPLALFSSVFLVSLWFLAIWAEKRWRNWSWYRSQNQGFLVLTFGILFTLFHLPLAFWRESPVYLLIVEKLMLFTVLVACLVYWFKRSGR